MKKFFICLTICFSFLFISNVSASINTTSGSFPDLPSGYENSDFIIVLRNNGTYRLFLWNTGVHEVDGGGTLNFYTSSYNRSTSVRIYDLSNNRWSYYGNTGNYAYSYNTLIATTTKIYARKYFDTLIHDSGYGLINNTIFTVNFHLNGGSVWDMSNILDPHLITEDFSIESTTDELSEYLTHLTPIKPYSNFIGWYYDSDFTLPYDSSNELSSNINLYAKFELYDYLQGYTQINLEPGERYVIFSSSTISSGSVFIPISDFNNYGSRISYFDKDLDTQPYTSYIQDFSTTSDGLFAKQDFDLSSYSGSDFIMFSKYIYLEGPDDFSSSVWVPDSMYSSIVEVTPNNTGGNDFDFSYVDSDGELQGDVISSSDLSQGSPLVSDLFTNFTTKDYGLSSIITAPIPLLQTLNNTSCSTVDLPLGIFGGVHDRKLSLPCMTPVYSSVFGELFTLYQTISSGVVAYFIGLAYFNKIKQFKDPENDSIEVVNL